MAGSKSNFDTPAYLSLANPAATGPDFYNLYALPDDRVPYLDTQGTYRLNPDAPFITREVKPQFDWQGGGIEVVVIPGAATKTGQEPIDPRIYPPAKPGVFP
jgi:hypothetical protein